MGVAPGDAVEMEGRAELGERVRVLRKERAVTIHVEFQRQAVLHKGTREEIEVSQEVFLPVDVRAGAEPGAIVQQVQPQIVPWVAGEPAVGRGIQLPECPALRPCQRRAAAAGRRGGSGCARSWALPSGGRWRDRGTTSDDGELRQRRSDRARAAGRRPGDSRRRVGSGARGSAVSIQLENGIRL